MNKEFEKFVDFAGGTIAAAKILNCSAGQMSHIKTGRREVSKAMAKTITDNYPQLSLSRLLYPETEAA